MIEQKHLTIDAVNKYIKQKLYDDNYLQNIAVEAEVANARDPKGQMYNLYFFSLKGKESEMNAYIKTSSLEEKLRLFAGGTFIFYGSVNHYIEKGRTTFIVQKFEKKADLKDKKEATKKRLIELGYIPAPQRVLKKFPQQVGVVTAGGHAAIQDMYQALKERNPLIKIVHYSCLVQGEGAPQSICQALNEAANDSANDCIILGRGGGSIEDLSAFDNLEVCLALAKIQVPTISAVGHSIDVSLTDLVASFTAITPTAAAHLFPEIKNIISEINVLYTQNKHALKSKINMLKNLVAIKKYELLRFTPMAKMSHYQSLLERYKLVFKNKLNDYLIHYKHELSVFKPYLNDIYEDYLNKQKVVLQRKQKKLKDNCSIFFNKKRYSVTCFSHLLELNNPMRILQEGYAKIKKLTNQDIKKAHDLKVGEEYYTYFLDGKIKAKVITIDNLKGVDND